MSTDMIWQTRSSDSDATEKLGEHLAQLIKPSMVIELRADLGGGKTTFARGLAKGLGVSGAVTSPSFTLSREYQAQSGMKLYHFDFYRLTESGVLADQLAEATNDQKGIVVVEWSDIVKDVLPAERLTIEFQPVAGEADERDITFRYPESMADLVRGLETVDQGTKP